MLSWVISVAGVMTLTVLLDIIMPDGQTNKYIKGIFSVFIIIAIALPLSGFLSGGIDLDRLFDFSTKEYGIDNGYILGVYADAYGKEEERLLDILADKGYSVEKADIVFDPSDKRKILYVNIFLKQQVIGGNPEHINISGEIKETVSKRYGIKKEDVRILDW